MSFKPSLIRETLVVKGYANGLKPKTLQTRVGEMSLQIPQTRDYHDENGQPFYPQSLASKEKGTQLISGFRPLFRCEAFTSPK